MVSQIRVRFGCSYVVQCEKGRTHFGLYDPYQWGEYDPSEHTLSITMRIYNGRQDRRSQ
jgi:hypothetical protein